MPKICAYIITHDTGYAPKIKKEICILDGCKKRTIEKNADEGDWIIGVGGKRLGETKGNREKYYRKLIYAMKVQSSNPPRSSKFSFFGDKAKDFSEELYKFVFKTNWRTKYFRDMKDFTKISSYLNQLPRDEIGEHCDLPEKKNKCKKC